MIRSLRYACGITNRTKTHPEYVILIVFQSRYWLRERTSMLSALPLFSYCVGIIRFSCYSTAAWRSTTRYCYIEQCFSTAGPRPGTGPWHQLHREARGSAGICHFSFLRNFHEEMFHSGNILRRKIFVNVSKNSDPDVGLRKLHYATRFH